MPIEDPKLLTRISKLMALSLRHKPEALGLTLDEHGWADVVTLVRSIQQKYRSFDRETLDLIVATNNKKRYAYSEDGRKIRANQGHSINVDVELKEAEPPDVLYHGTATRFIDAIAEEGLKPMSRLYVHLSVTPETARQVGSRHGRPVVYRVDTKRMKEDGCVFYLSENGIWLAKSVSKEYLQICGVIPEVPE